MQEGLACKSNWRSMPKKEIKSRKGWSVSLLSKTCPLLTTSDLSKVWMWCQNDIHTLDVKDENRLIMQFEVILQFTRPRKKLKAFQRGERAYSNLEREGEIVECKFSFNCSKALVKVRFMGELWTIFGVVNTRGELRTRKENRM